MCWVANSVAVLFSIGLFIESVLLRSIRARFLEIMSFKKPGKHKTNIEKRGVKKKRLVSARKIFNCYSSTVTENRLWRVKNWTSFNNVDSLPLTFTNENRESVTNLRSQFLVKHLDFSFQRLGCIGSLLFSFTGGQNFTAANVSFASILETFRVVLALLLLEPSPHTIVGHFVSLGSPTLTRQLTK